MYILVLWLLSSPMGSGKAAKFIPSRVDNNGSISSTISFASKESCEKALSEIQIKSRGKIDGICVSTK